MRLHPPPPASVADLGAVPGAGGQRGRVGKERVQKLMQLHGVRAKGKRRCKVTTDSNHDLPIARNLLHRQFTVAEPDRVWAVDITYIATDEGWLFLAVCAINRFGRQSRNRTSKKEARGRAQNPWTLNRFTFLQIFSGQTEKVSD